jgi:PPOX class probable F420-dependent enzyme
MDAGGHALRWPGWVDSHTHVRVEPVASRLRNVAASSGGRSGASAWPLQSDRSMATKSRPRSVARGISNRPREGEIERQGQLPPRRQARELPPDRETRRREPERLEVGAVPKRYRDLFQKRGFAHVATLRPDGSPHVTPVWVDYDGTHVRFNTARGRAKLCHLERDPRIAVAIQDPDDPYRYVQVRGRVVEVTEYGADAHIDALAKKYLGQDRYPFRQSGEIRVTCKVIISHVSGS